MSFTVKEALGLSQLKGAAIIAGERGATRTIEHVTVVDAPDAINWLRGGELVLTTAYEMKGDQAALLKFVKGLSDKRAAGLGIKLGRFFDDISEEIKEFADGASFPIVSIPFEVAWIDVITPVLTEVVQRQASVLKRSMDIHTQFIDSVIKGGGMQDVANLLTNQLDSPCCITDLRGNVLASSLEPRKRGCCEDVDWGKLARHVVAGGKGSEEWENSRDMKRIGVDWDGYEDCCHIIEAMCGQNGQSWGRILVLEDPDRAFSRMDAISISHAVTVATLVMLRLKTAENVERRFRSSFWDDYLHGRYDTWEEIVKRGESFSVDLTVPNVVLAISADADEPGKATIIGGDGGLLQDEIIRLATAYGTKYWGNRVTALAYRGGAAVVAPWTQYPDSIEAKKRAMELAKHLHEKVNASIAPLTVSVGVGRFEPDPKDTGKSYSEAYECISIGAETFGQNSVMHFDQLGAYRVFSRCNSRDDLERFADDELGLLEEYDAKHNAELVFHWRST